MWESRARWSTRRQRRRKFLVEEYRRAGLELHVKKCKTCVVMSCNVEGREAKAKACEEIVARHGGLPFAAATGVCYLPVDHEYKHVGCWSRADGKQSIDVATKMCAIKGSAAGLKRHVLANKSLGTAQLLEGRQRTPMFFLQGSTVRALGAN